HRSVRRLRSEPRFPHPGRNPLLPNRLAREAWAPSPSGSIPRPPPSPRAAMPTLRCVSLRSLLLLPLLLAPACGGSSDPKDLTEAGYAALGAGDSKAALGEFDQALAAIGSDTAHPQYLRAKLGAI